MVKQQKVVQNNTKTTIWVVVEGVHSHHVYFKSGPVGPEMRVTLERKAAKYAPCVIKAFGKDNLENLLCEVNEQEVQASNLIVETIAEEKDKHLGELHPLYAPDTRRTSIIRGSNGLKSLFSLARGIAVRAQRFSISSRARADSLKSLDTLNTVRSSRSSSASFFVEAGQERYRFRESNEAGLLFHDLNQRSQKVKKTGLLTKQGGVIKTWHTRFFVLSDIGLQYYENAAAFRSKRVPLGSLSFDDMIISSSANSPVDPVPSRMYNFVRRSHCFCVSSTERTLVISAPSETIMLEWMGAIEGEFNRFLEQQSLRISVLNRERELEAGVPEHGRRRAIVNVVKGADGPKGLNETLNDVVDKLLDDFEYKVARSRNLHVMRRMMLMWRAVTVANKHGVSLNQILNHSLPGTASRPVAPSMVTVGTASSNFSSRAVAPSMVTVGTGSSRRGQFTTQNSMVLIDDGNIVPLFPEQNDVNELQGMVVI